MTAQEARAQAVALRDLEQAGGLRASLQGLDVALLHLDRDRVELAHLGRVVEDPQSAAEAHEGDVAQCLLSDTDKLLVLATDGVWDVMDNDEALNMGLSSKPAAACTAIVDACARRWDTQMPGRRDDITTVVVDLTHADVTPPPPRISSFPDGS